MNEVTEGGGDWRPRDQLQAIMILQIKYSGLLTKVMEMKVSRKVDLKLKYKELIERGTWPERRGKSSLRLSSLMWASERAE